MDSKRITSAAKIAKLSQAIRATRGVAWEVISIGPKRYNELYESIRNLNELLAWGHAKVIAGLAAKVPGCPRALSDQFANPRVLQRALAKQEIEIELEQKTKGESDVAVAAASILARERFVTWLKGAEEEWKAEFPLGAGPGVDSAGRRFLEERSVAELRSVAKLHFRTYGKITGGAQ